MMTEIEQEPDGFNLDAEAARQDEAAMAGIVEREAEFENDDSGEEHDGAVVDDDVVEDGQDGNDEELRNV